MNLHMVGCNHHKTALEMRQQLAFDAQQTSEALSVWRSKVSGAEIALLSTCNRVELYAATTGEETKLEITDLIDTMLDYRHLSRQQIENQLLTLSGNDVIKHLFRVAAAWLSENHKFCLK